MSKTVASGPVNLELAKLYAARGDLLIAMEKANESADFFLAEKEFNSYLACQNLLLRCYAERDESDKINLTKEKIQDLVLKEGFELNSKTYYTLGTCSLLKRQLDSALDYFQKSLAIGLAADNKEDLCYAITGLAYTYMRLGKLSEALREIYNLQVFFEVLNLPDVKLSVQILNGIVLQKLERYDQALDMFWSCYDTLRQEKNLYMYLNLLFSIGATYQAMGEGDLARVYFQLAKKSTDPNNLRLLTKDIDKKLKELGLRSDDEFDLVFDPINKLVLEKKRGKIDFKNQFILLDLLHLFLKAPGHVYPKDAIVQKIWSQDYDPSVHDNKIYVTIKRLRKLIEPDIDKPKYIFRAKNGYYLNKNTRILIEQ